MPRRTSVVAVSRLAQFTSKGDSISTFSSSRSGLRTPAGELEATAIIEDLQKCRRMVASMRGLVLATSLRQQIVRDIEQVASARALSRHNEKIGSRSGQERQCPDSPRQRYLQEFQFQRVRIIQKLWKKIRMQKLVLDKLKMERMWREKRGVQAQKMLSLQHLKRASITELCGVKRFEASALLVQRVFRGFWARKTMHKRLSIVDLTVLKHKMTKIEALRAECASYNKKLDDHEQELNQTILDLEKTLKDKATTESKIATSKKDVAFVDAKLLDGTVVRMEAHQLLIHQINEIARLEAAQKRLEALLEELKSFDPGANRAASIIQSRFRTHKHEIQQQAKLRRKRQAYIRLVVSKERCYERMNESLLLRHEEMWSSSANAIASLYQIAKAKILLQRYRQQHAATKISQQYRLMKLRVQAKARLKWLKTKRKAQQFHAKRVRTYISKVSSAWRLCVAMEKARKALIEQRVENGLTKWITEIALRLQRLHQIVMTKHHLATQQYADQLDPVVLHSLEVLSRNLGTFQKQHQDGDTTAKRELCTTFYEQLLCEVSAWQVPQAHLYFLSERYKIPLEVLPVPKVKAWLKRRLHNASTKTGFVDLLPPFPIRTLKFLAKVSSYYALQQRVAWQAREIRVLCEAKMVVREYLALLYANNQVLYSAATTFSAQLRHEAVLLLRRRGQEEVMETVRTFTSSSSLSPSLPVIRHAFTSFHCLWNDLCEKCLMLQPQMVVATTQDGHSKNVHQNHQQKPKQPRACDCCGHRHFEKSTTANQSYAAFPKIGQNNNLLPSATTTLSSPTTRRKSANQQQQQQQQLLFSDHERCDFLVLNAFFQALAPLDHSNRVAHTPETLWKLAMAHAFGTVTVLYEQLQISSLSSLLLKLKALSSSSSVSPSSLDEMAEWGGVMPPPVLEKLLLFGKLLYAELLEVEAELRTRQATGGWLLCE